MSKGTRATILGTLIHRALAMPATSGSPIQATAASRALRVKQIEAAELLVEVFKSCNESHRYSRARLIADPGGPTMSKIVNQYFRLSKHDCQWILNRIVPSVTVAAEALYAWERSHFEVSETTAWGECYVSPPGSDADTLRADTVLIDPSRVVVVDYKTTSDDYRLESSMEEGALDAQKRSDAIPASWWSGKARRRDCIGVAIHCATSVHKVDVLIGEYNPDEQYTRFAFRWSTRKLVDRQSS